MKRTMFAVLFAVFGPIYLLVLPFVVQLVASGNGAQYFGSDEVNRRLRVYFLFGGGLFAGIWGWVGGVLAATWRRGLSMIAGLLLGTTAAVVVLQIVASGMAPVDSRGLVGFVLVLALVSCAGAYMAGLIFDRSTGSPL